MPNDEILKKSDFFVVQFFTNQQKKVNFHKIFVKASFTDIDIARKLWYNYCV